MTFFWAYGAISIRHSRTIRLIFVIREVTICMTGVRT